MGLASKLPAARTLRKVSSRPLAFVMDNFVDAPTLATFQRGRRPTAQMDGKAAQSKCSLGSAPAQLRRLLRAAQLGTPRKRPCRWTRSQCLGCSS